MENFGKLHGFGYICRARRVEGRAIEKCIEKFNCIQNQDTDDNGSSLKKFCPIN